MKAPWRVRRRWLNRRRRRLTTRRLTGGRRSRRTIRLVVGGRQVNYMVQAIEALKRAVRAHRRLIKLAPERFDPTVIERLARERELHERFAAEITAALDKVYEPKEEKPHQGQNDFRCGNGVETDWFSGPPTEQMERWMCEWELWTSVGRAAWERHDRLQPHRRLSPRMIVRLLEVVVILGEVSLATRPFACGRKGSNEI